MLSAEMIQDLVNGLQNIFGNSIEQIILYGSVARNEASEESDIDIAIILQDDMLDGMKQRFIKWSSEMDLRYNKVFSIVDINKQTIEKWGNVVPFYKNIQKEGIVLWKAA